MGYLGNAPARNTPAYKQVYEFVATAGQTTFAVPYTPGFVEVYRNGVKLGAPNFTANNGTSVVLTSGANAGDFIQIVSEFINPVLNAIPNTAGAVVTSNIADGAITTAKIANGAVVQADLATGVAGTGPAFSAYQNFVQTISNNTETKLQINTEDFDTAGAYDSTTNYRFLPLVAGYYQFNFSCYGGGTVNTQLVTAKIAKNGALLDYTQGRGGAYVYMPAAYSDGLSAGSQLVYLNGSTDYIEMYARVVGSGTIGARGAMSASMVRAA